MCKLESSGDADDIIRDMRSLFFAGLVATAATWAGPRPSAPVTYRSDFVFEPNVGQTDPQVRFWGHAPGAGLWLTESGAVVSFQEAGSKRKPKRAVLGMTFDGAQAHPRIEAADPGSGRSNYFLGNDPAKWRTGVAQFGRVRYREVYPGIDVVFYGNPRQLEYDWIVAPGADPRAIHMSFRGEKSMRIDAAGDLVLSVGGVEIRERKPAVYQERDGRRHEIGGRFVRRGRHAVGFDVARYDSTRPLTIDPALGSSTVSVIYSTYLGNTYVDAAEAVAVDLQGKIFVGGTTLSAGFPSRFGLYGSGVDSTDGDTNGFIAKFDPSQTGGASFIWSTFFGGGTPASEQTFVLGVATDVQGNVYFTGDTASPTMALKNPFQSNFESSDTCTDNPDFDGDNECTDAFVAKISAAGDKLIYSSYLGGAGTDYGAAISVDITGTAWVAGSTRSNDLKTTATAFQSSLRGAENAFLAEVTPDGGTLAYLTYIGGDGVDLVTSMAVDKAGVLYIAGTTTSGSFPTRGQGSGVSPFQKTRAGTSDAFVLKMNPSLESFQQLVYCTYVGGGPISSSIFHGVVVDSAGKIYLTGSTNAPNFPVTTMTAFQPTYTANPKGFSQQLNAMIPGLSYIYGNAVVTELNPAATSSASQLVYSTFLGGSNMEIAQALALDPIGRLLITGQTASADFPITASTALQTANRASGYYPFTGFLSLLDPTIAGAAGLVYSTYFGGNTADIPVAVAVDPTGGVILAGVTASTDFTTVNAYQGHYGGPIESSLPNSPTPGDAFITRFDFSQVGGQQVSTLAHVADGNGFRTLVLLVNTGTTPAAYTLQFFDQNGTPVTYPLAPGQSMSGTIAPGSQQIVQTTGQGGSTNLGWGQLTAPSFVKGMLIYQQQATPTSLQEGSAPIETASSHFFVPFDNSTGDVTSIGLANPSASQAATVVLTMRFEVGGGTFTLPQVILSPLQQIAQPLTTLAGSSVGTRGLIEIAASTPVALVAFRFQGAAFTLFDTSPPVASVATPITSTIAHVADGNNFRTTIILNNTGTADAPYTLSILNALGQPQTFGLDATSSLTGTVKTGGTTTINTTGLGAVTNFGWAQLIAPPSVGGLAVFRQTNPGQNEQQATVPITQYSLQHFFVPFDNVGNTTSIALANPDPAITATINVTFRYTDGTSNTGQFVLAPMNYTAQQLAQIFTQVAGRGGVAEFSSNTPVAIVEVRFNPTQAFTSLRSVAP